MSSMEAGEETTSRKPEQHVVKSTHEMHIWKRHENHKTISEIYSCFRKWEPQKEIWAYRYGPAVLGTASTMSACYINFYFRETLFLLNYTRLTSYGIMFLAPGITAGALHYFFVTRNILQETKQSACSVCLQVKGMTLQGISSIGYPLILVPLICYPVAKRLNNYSVPNMTYSNTSSIIQFTREVLRPIRGQLWAITAAQIVLGMGMTFFEQNNFALKVKPKLDKMKTIFSPQDPRPLAKRKRIAPDSE